MLLFLCVSLECEFRPDIWFWVLIGSLNWWFVLNDICCRSCYWKSPLNLSILMLAFSWWLMGSSIQLRGISSWLVWARISTFIGGFGYLDLLRSCCSYFVFCLYSSRSMYWNVPKASPYSLTSDLLFGINYDCLTGLPAGNLAKPCAVLAYRFPGDSTFFVLIWWLIFCSISSFFFWP